MCAAIIYYSILFTSSSISQLYKNMFGKSPHSHISMSNEGFVYNLVMKREISVKKFSLEELKEAIGGMAKKQNCSPRWLFFMKRIPALKETSNSTKYLNKNENYNEILEMPFVFDLQTVSTERCRSRSFLSQYDVVGCGREVALDGFNADFYQKPVSD